MAKLVEAAINSGESVAKIATYGVKGVVAIASSDYRGALMGGVNIVKEAPTAAKNLEGFKSEAGQLIDKVATNPELQAAVSVTKSNIENLKTNVDKNINELKTAVDKPFDFDNISQSLSNIVHFFKQAFEKLTETLKDGDKVIESAGNIGKKALEQTTKEVGEEIKNSNISEKLVQKAVPLIQSAISQDSNAVQDISKQSLAKVANKPNGPAI